MSGIGGWLASAGSSSPDAVLSAFGAAVSGVDNAPVRTWRYGAAGLAIAGTSDNTALVASESRCVAIFGHPRWVEGVVSITVPQDVCQRFDVAYRTRGVAALESLQGDFALVVIDTAANQALVATDRFAVRAMVYQADENAFLFGSSCDVLLCHPAANPAVDRQAIYDYTYFHVVPAPKTIYGAQRRLLPGECVSWREHKAQANAYWSMNFTEQAGSVADFKPRFRKLLSEAVASAAAGVRCGAFLSGGTDSSTVAGTLGEVAGKPAKTYSIGFAVEGYDEMEYARIASRHFGTEQHEYYVTPEDVVDALPRIAAAYDQPFGNASAVAAYYCARLAKSDGVMRLLAGDGGDEVFGGNSRYAKQHQFAYYEKLPGLARSLLEAVFLSVDGIKNVPLLRKGRSYIEQASRPMPARYDSYNLIDRLGPDNLFTPEFLARIDLGSPLKLMQETFKPYQGASLINQMLGIDFKFTLGDSDLPKVTKMCELAGMDVAFPLLDEALVSFSGILPADLKLRGTYLRYFFKEALRDFLPSEIITKEKHGFGLPVGAWLTTHPALKALAGDSLASLKRRGIIAPAFIDRLLGEHMRTHAAYYGTMAWVLMMLELWFQKHPAARL